MAPQYNTPVEISMDDQVILLPRENYWEWVSAARDYALKFGVNLTPEPHVALTYMSPRQVISFPYFSQSFPEYGDMKAWLRERDSDVRLDPISVSNPDELQKVFERRIKDDDRYGQKQKSFFLLWPTNYPVITQRFRANPRLYARYDLPGHEGLDFRALPNTNIYACADGVVYLVENNPKAHAYGIHVRIRHKDGFRTVYGHLIKALVRKGESVRAGQLIGRADSTGYSSASHLHLTLKRDRATVRRETDYPKDIIDPTPFMVWPSGVSSKGFRQFQWIPEKCLVGAHVRIGGSAEADDLSLVQQADLEAVMVDYKETNENLQRMRELRPGTFIMARIRMDLSGEAVKPEQYSQGVLDDLNRLYTDGVRYFEVHSNPNLQSEGWGRSWVDGRDFSDWFLKVIEILRKSCPDAQYGFPGLSPGPVVQGKRADAIQFFEESEPAVLSANWIGVNCFWSGSSGVRDIRGGRIFEEYRARFPEKLLFITEFGNPTLRNRPSVVTAQYLEFYKMVRELPGFGGAFAFGISAVDGYGPLVWRDNLGTLEELAEQIGKRDW